MTEAILLRGSGLTIDEVVRIARRREKAALDEPTRMRIQAGREVVERLAADLEHQVYGINTGFGSLKDVVIDAEHLATLQRNLLMSHAAGMGDPLPVEIVRAAMALRANALAKGASGVRPVVVETLISMLNRGVHPYIPAQGSVGASGDLAPLSHLALVISRPADEALDDPQLSGEVLDETGGRGPGKAAMEQAGIERLVLGAKEGLALNNGVQISTAIALLALVDGERLARLADLACAMTLEGVRGVPEAFMAEVHRYRPFAGQIASAAAVARYIAGSSLAGSDSSRVQDGYSIRCAPQVHGAVRDTLVHVRRVLEVEINSATDNPLIVEIDGGQKTISAGQFHGEPIALAADAMKTALSELASISERRIFRLLTRALSFGLPPLLVPPDRPGLGLMTLQFTAAGLVAENKHVAHPSSVDNVPTCEDQEDHVSMSPISARGARRIAQNTTYVLAAELLCAAHALAMRRKQGPCRMGAGVQRGFELCRRALELDSAGAAPSVCLEQIHDQIQNGEFDALVSEAPQ